MTRTIQRRRWQQLWRTTRALNWGTLHFRNDAYTAELLRETYNGRNSRVLNRLEARKYGLTTAVVGPAARLP